MRLWCQECCRPSGTEAKGWRLYRTDIPDEDEEHTLALLARMRVCELGSLEQRANRF